MAHPKRKRIPTTTISNKRPKHTQPDTDSSSSSSSSEEEEIADESTIEWEAERISDQRGRGFGLEYLIEWKGIDPATGTQWEPTWERAVKANISESLRASWKAEQARRAEDKKTAVVAAGSSAQHQGLLDAPPAQAIQTRAARPRRIVESSETSSSEPATDLPTDISQSTAAAPSTIDIGAPIHDWTSPQVNIDVRGDSSNRGGYGLHAEIPESQPSPAKSITEDTEPDSSYLFASQAAFRASGVVPDTQSSGSDVSYIPVTQEELESSLHSDSSDESAENHVIGYSVLLDHGVARRLGARSQSPATSIAETIADTTQDLQSQRQIESQQEQSEIPETLESPIASSKSGRTATQNSSASSYQTNFAPSHSQSSASQHEEHSSEEVLFVENTTQFDHKTSQRDPQLPPQVQGEHSASIEEQQEPVEPSTQLVTSLAELQVRAIADTPQISQLTSTTDKNTTHEEPTNPAYQFESAQFSTENDTDISLTERSVLEENALFPFLSQHPACFDPRSAKGPTQRDLTEHPRACSPHQATGVRLSQNLTASADQEFGKFNESEESTTIDEISQPLEQEETHASRQGSSVLRPSQTGSGDREANTALRSTEGILNQGSSLVVSQPPQSSKLTGSREHNVQLVPSSAYLSTQVVTGSILATVELDQAEAFASKHSSPCSRHDSSQETPERLLQSAEPSSSPILHPPSYSLDALDSNAPSRPVTPTLTSFKMTESTAESTSAKVDRELKERIAANRAANPYTPRRQRIRASQPSSVASAGAGTAGSPLQPGKAPALPIINVSAEGTRSPSTVPDRSPAPPAQTSLRTVAIANAKDKAIESLLENPLAATSTNTDAGPSQEKAEFVAAVAAGAAPTQPIASPRRSLNDDVDNFEEMSDIENDVDDDIESMFGDDLQLDREEYIVPLFIEGRQSDTYSSYIQEKAELFDKCIGDPTGFESHDKVEEAINYMKAVETHPDLIYAEAESATGHELRPAQVQQEAQYGIENSVKFKFLQELFNDLREQSIHVVLLLEQDNEALFSILRTFFAATSHNYTMPTKGYQANTFEDALTISIFPATASPILRPADLIICLDGVLHAATIRQSSWAVAPGKTVPVLHLVIPQTVGHIERYISPGLDRRNRIDATLVALSQIQGRHEIGKPIDIDSPSATEAAHEVAAWLIAGDDPERLEWPLPTVGSLKPIMEHSTQQPAVSAPSSPVPERAKRPLEADDSDTAKRVRYTPQPRVISNSSIHPEDEVTRISDSLPGTAAAEHARLVTSLDKANSELLRMLKEHREERVMWDRQQTEHENRQQDYRRLFNEKAEVDRAHESMTRNRDKLRTQLETQATELRTLREELEAQRTLGLESTNEKDVEITRLRKDLEAAHLERAKALASVKSTEQTLEYTKEQYRDASNTAGQLQTDLTSLETQNAHLAHQASGEQAKLKQLHLDSAHKNLLQQCKVLRNENALLKATLKQKEEELVRAKNNSGRTGYGTRAASTTPQPKTRSRAASPTGSRVARGGRMSNILAEER